MKKYNYYTIAIGSYCDRDVAVHDTEKEAKIHAKLKNNILCDNFYNGNREAWLDDPEATQFFYLSRVEMEKNYPKTLAEFEKTEHNPGFKTEGFFTHDEYGRRV